MSKHLTTFDNIEATAKRMKKKPARIRKCLPNPKQKHYLVGILPYLELDLFSFVAAFIYNFIVLSKDSCRCWLRTYNTQYCEYAVLCITLIPPIQALFDSIVLQFSFLFHYHKETK